MNVLEHLHETRVHVRRVRVLATAAARLLPAGARYLLDIGCGDGALGAGLARQRPELDVRGVEVAVRKHTAIPVQAFDGRTLPCADQSHDAVMLVDVLHHTTQPAVLLREAVRVARRWILLKDHDADGFAAHATLQFMDRVGNRRHGVVRPHHYLTRAQWSVLFAEFKLRVVQHDSLPQLYPFPVNLVFGRRLHFFALLETSA